MSDNHIVRIMGCSGVVVGAALFVGACTPTGAHRGANAEEAGCDVPAPDPAATVDERSTPLVIVQTRNHELMVYPARGGLEFTVALAGSGALLADHVSEEAFRRGFPGLYDHFESAFADEHGHSGVAWAGL